MEERANALLTKAQREALQEEGRGEYTRQYRQRIRERAQNGTVDLSLLFDKMESKDIERAFGPDLNFLKMLREISEEMIKTVDSRQARYELMDLRSDLAHLGDASGGSYSSSDTQLNAFSKSAPSDIANSTSEVQRLGEETIERLERVLHLKQDSLKNLKNTKDELDELTNSDLDVVSASLLKELRNLSGHQISMAEDELAEIKQALATLRDSLPEDIQAAQEVIMDLARATDRSRKAGEAVSDVRRIRNEIDELIEEATFADGMEEHVTVSLAFYLRVSEILGADTESIVREALLRTYQHEHPEQTVGNITVDISAMNRDEASKRAVSELREGSRWLEVTELRALAETNPAELRALVETEEITEAELRNAVLSRLDSIESGLEIVDEDPKVSGGGRVPDMVARDEDGQLVLLEFKRSLETLDEERIDELEEMVNQYGGLDRARVIVVFPAESLGADQSPLESDRESVRFAPIRVRLA